MITFRLPGLFFRVIATSGLMFIFVMCAGNLRAEDDTNSVIEHLKKTFEDIHGRFQTQTNDAELAWQLGRSCFDMSMLQNESSQVASFAEQGIAACRRSLALSNSVEAHYYLGMNIGQLADTKHNLSGLRMVKDMEREFLASELLDEHLDYGGPDRNLGLLYRETPVIVSIGSRTKARQHLQKAVDLAPDFPENRLNLIESYLKWDYRTEALRELQELEKIWPEARKKYTGEQWVLSWADWNKRLSAVKKKLGAGEKVIVSPHSTQ
jgi:tetratricopeptide (TPR) repeat protein